VRRNAALVGARALGVIGSARSPIEFINAGADRFAATGRGAAAGTRSIEACGAGFVTIVMSIQHPRADVTTQYRGKFGALRRERSSPSFSFTAMTA
jgi:hypothetical protein